LPVPTVRIACAQLASELRDLDGNRRRSLEAIEAAAEAGAELVVLPELCSSGYAFADRDEAFACAEPAGGATLTAWAEAAGRLGVVVAGGFAEVAGDRLHNSASLVDAIGVRAVYRKLHLWDREKLLFEPGAELPPVVETPAGRVALGICHDMVFRADPCDGARRSRCADLPDQLTADRGPRRSAADGGGGRHGDRARQPGGGGDRRPLRPRARHGFGWAASVIVAPSGGLLAGPPASGAGPLTIFADCELDQARDKRCGERNDLVADRRHDVYDAV
jgi:carbon-nitrogen hydrolase